MNVIERTGDIFSTTMPAIGHGVNVRGAMGAGIAVLFRNRFSEMYEAYRNACATGALQPGYFFPFEENGTWIMNLASQDNPGPHARLEWVESSLAFTLDFMNEYEITGLALPRIGAGIGGLNWDEVKTVMIHEAAKYPNIALELWSLPDA